LARGLLPARHRLARGRPRAGRRELITRTPDTLPIRRAAPGEAPALSDLCLRAKAHWGYDPAFLDLCRAALTVDPDAIRAGDVFVATDSEDRPIGLHQIAEADGDAEIELVLLYVEPGWIGRGVGRALFRHAADLARERGGVRLTILADPHAAPFYQAEGAVYRQDAPSDAIPGRMLPVYVLPLRTTGGGA
jgi:GNAT superfamily N-acetyltransferase